MKGILKLIALTAAAGVVASSFGAASATDSSEDKVIRNYAAFDEADPLVLRTPTVTLEKTEAVLFEGKDGTLPYRIYKSPAYDADNKEAPAFMLVFLHGSGGSGNDNKTQITDQATIVNYLVSDLADEIFKDLPYIVVAPQCPIGSQWVNSPYATGTLDQDGVPISKPMQLLIELIESLKANENIDPENIALGGISMGGYGTWDLGTRRPDLFSTLIPICGGGDPDKAEAIKDKRIWVFHGDKDTAVPVKASRDMVEALNKLGAENLTYTEFENVGHNAWTPAMTDVKDPYLLEWLIEGITYNVTTEKEGEGTVTESKTGVKRGESVRIELNAAEGYFADKVYINGVETLPTVLQDGTAFVELKNITKSQTVKALFTAIPVEEEPPVEKKGLSKGAIAAIAGGAALLLAAGVGALLASKKKKK